MADGGMMKTYKELKKQLDELIVEIETARKVEFDSVVEQIRELIGIYQIAARDLFPQATSHQRTVLRQTRRGIPKYWNPETGSTWSGRGREPNWIKGVSDRRRFILKG